MLAYGGSDQLREEEAPRPTPAADQVLVRIRAAGVNPVDWKLRAGYLREVMPLQFPRTAGQDFAGEVLESGLQAGELRPGERVFGFAPGAYAEFAVVAATRAAHIPAGLSFETAAALPTPGLTALQLVTQAVAVAEGQTVLIHGAAGAVGALAVQIAKLRGARVAGTALGAEDAEYLRQLGVDPVIDNRAARFEDFVQDVDAAIDLVGGEILDRTYAVVKPGGVLATTVGRLNAEALAARRLRGEPFLMRRNAGDLAAVADLVAGGRVRPRIAQVLPFTQAARAQDLNQRGEARGELILRVA